MSDDLESNSCGKEAFRSAIVEFKGLISKTFI